MKILGKENYLFIEPNARNTSANYIIDSKIKQHNQQESG
jgi:hypothetical protein